MPDVADVAAIEAIADRVVEQIISRVTEYVDRHHDEQAQEIAELATTVRLAAAGVTKMIEQLSASRPPGDQPPAVLDAACAADPADGPQRVELDVHGRHVVEYVTPGDDPSAVWADTCAAVTSQTPGAGAWQN